VVTIHSASPLFKLELFQTLASKAENVADMESATVGEGDDNDDHVIEDEDNNNEDADEGDDDDDADRNDDGHDDDSDDDGIPDGGGGVVNGDNLVKEPDEDRLCLTVEHPRLKTVAWSKLTPLEVRAQRMLSARQILTIEDPMEMGRTLGVTFQGMDRLMFEFRRAHHLLNNFDPNDEHCTDLDQLFSDYPTPPKSVWKLLEQRKFKSVLFPHLRDAPSNKQIVFMDVPLSRGDAGRIIGPGGKTVKMLKESSGIRSVSVADDDKSVCISGTPESVRVCEKHISQLINESPQHTFHHMKSHHGRGRGRNTGYIIPSDQSQETLLPSCELTGMPAGVNRSLQQASPEGPPSSPLGALIAPAPQQAAKPGRGGRWNTSQKAKQWKIVRPTN